MSSKDQWTHKDDVRVLARIGSAYLGVFMAGLAGAVALLIILGPPAHAASSDNLYAVTITSNYTKCVDVMPERKAEHYANRAIHVNDGSYQVSLSAASQHNIRRSGTCKDTTPSVSQSASVQATKSAIEQLNQPVEIDKGSALEAALLDDGYTTQTYENRIQEDAYPPSLQTRIDAFNHQPDSVRLSQSQLAFQLAQASGGSVAEDYSIVPQGFYSSQAF